MECTEGIMIGKAQALDIPIDTIKEFVEIFNSHVPTELSSPEFSLDINELQKIGNIISLKWETGVKKCEFEYNLDDKKFYLINN